MLKTALRWTLIAFVALALLSMLALWSWGRFAAGAQGDATQALLACVTGGGKILICGNGASGALAQYTGKALEVTNLLTARGATVYPYCQLDGRHCEADWRRQLGRCFTFLFGWR